jgi:hypothetical protein
MVVKGNINTRKNLVSETLIITGAMIGWAYTPPAGYKAGYGTGVP